MGGRIAGYLFKQESSLNLQKIYEELNENFQKNCEISVETLFVWFSKNWALNEISSVFRKFTDNLPKGFQ